MVVVQLSSLRLMAALSLTARSTVRARAPGLARLFSAGRCGLARSFQLLELQLLELCCALCAQAFPGFEPRRGCQCSVHDRRPNRYATSVPVDGYHKRYPSRARVSLRGGEELS